MSNIRDNPYQSETSLEEAFIYNSPNSQIKNGPISQIVVVFLNAVIFSIDFFVD